MQLKLLRSNLEDFVCDTNGHLAILQKNLDQAMHIFTQKARVSGIRASVTMLDIRKFYKMYLNIVRCRFFSG